MKDRCEIRLSGTGGQGVVLAGILLAEAAGLRPGQHVVQTVSYGPQVRGGMSSAELVVSQEPIDYPKPLGLDLFVPLTEEAYPEGLPLMKPRGIILLDPDRIRQAEQGWVVRVPLGRIAKEATGLAQMMNVVAVGAAAALVPIADWEALEVAAQERAPAGKADAFVRAIRAGRTAAQRARRRISFEPPPSPED
jgi:2-oxoglutarate ferredoxin oxidoreductase subunit gamma